MEMHQKSLVGGLNQNAHNSGDSIPKEKLAYPQGWEVDTGYRLTVNTG